MTASDWLEPYYFHEQGFQDLEEIEEWFEWTIPETFNIATYTCDRWAEEDRIALYQREDDGQTSTYTFSELANWSGRLAAFLADRGIARGDRIAINGTQGIESLIGNMAAFKLGAVSIPLTELLGTDGLSYRLQDGEPVAFLAGAGAIETLRAVRPEVDSLELTLTYGDFAEGEELDIWTAIDQASEPRDTVETDPEDTAFIIYTSGTTGEPKGVVHAHRHLLGELPQFVSLQCHETGPDQVTRTVAEWSWIMSLPGMVLPAYFYGIPVVGAPAGSFDAEQEFDLIEDVGITHLNLPPTAVRMMMQVENPAEQYDLSSVQSFSTGGESADEGIINWVGETFEHASFLEGYGTSEVGGLISDDPGAGREHRLGYFGVPSVGHEVVVMDRETMEPIEEPHEIGELAVRYEGDPMLFVEYLNKPDKTAETIQDGWLLSDDLVSRDEDGYFRYHSRADDIIISSGYRIAPKEIEEALLAHEAVANTGVIGVPHETRGEIPKAFVVLNEGAEPDEETREMLQESVKERLAKYEYPREIAFVDELPKTTTGKVRRQSLREREGVE